MAELEEDFQTGDAGHSETYPMQCSDLRVDGFVVIKERPCKIVEMSTSEIGNHGHAKVHLVGLDLFTGKKYEDFCPSTHNMNVPNVSHMDYQLINIDSDGFCTLMDDNGTTLEDLKIPESEVGTEIRSKFDADSNFHVTVLKSMGMEAIVALKTFKA